MVNDREGFIHLRWGEGGGGWGGGGGVVQPSWEERGWLTMLSWYTAAMCVPLLPCRPLLHS